MQFWARLAAAAILCALGGVAWALMVAPVAAETTTITLTTNWQKVTPSIYASAFEIQATAGQVFVTTMVWCQSCGQAEPAAPSSSVVGRQMQPLERQCFTPAYANSEVYVRAGNTGPTANGSIILTDGVSCVGRGY